jgi:hypothetical protein
LEARFAVVVGALFRLAFFAEAFCVVVRFVLPAAAFALGLALVVAILPRVADGFGMVDLAAFADVLPFDVFVVFFFAAAFPFLPFTALADISSAAVSG